MGKRLNKFLWNAFTFGAAGAIDKAITTDKAINATATDFNQLEAETNKRLQEKFSEVSDAIKMLLVILFFVILFIYILK